MMWLLVMFDLPTFTSENRKAASEFRKYLLDEGFQMMQYSVYIRSCSGASYSDSLEKRMKYNLPSSGKIDILRITDKQYEQMFSYYQSKRLERINPPEFVVFQGGWEDSLPDDDEDEDEE